MTSLFRYLWWCYFWKLYCVGKRKINRYGNSYLTLVIKNITQLSENKSHATLYSTSTISTNPSLLSKSNGLYNCKILCHCKKKVLISTNSFKYSSHFMCELIILINVFQTDYFLRHLICIPSLQQISHEYQCRYINNTKWILFVNLKNAWSKIQ